MSSFIKKAKYTGRELWFTADKLFVRLQDGREIGVPIAWFPRLANATDAQRKNWRWVGGGVGIHWPELDEDLSISGLLVAS